MKTHGAVKNDTLKIRKGFLSEEEWRRLEVSWQQARNGHDEEWGETPGPISRKITSLCGDCGRLLISFWRLS
jgi:hypothetical protein